MVCVDYGYVPHIKVQRHIIYSDIVKYTVPVKKDWFHKRHHISTGIISRTYNSDMDGLQREKIVIFVQEK